MKISVKQLNMFGALQRPSIGGCPRQWAYYYLDGLRAPFLSPPLVEGIKFHAVCASLVVAGVMPPAVELQPGVVLSEEDVRPEGHLGKMARAALLQLPVRPYGEWVSEHVGTFPWRTSRGVECEIDLRPDLMSPIVDAQLCYLVDFKGTSDKRYALKSLADDVQANVYSHGLHLLGAGCTLARWAYVSKKTYASWHVEKMFHPEPTEKWLHENIDRTVELIQALREQGGVTGLDVGADEGACQGGTRFCDYILPCMGPVGAKPARLVDLETLIRYKESKET